MRDQYHNIAISGWLCERAHDTCVVETAMFADNNKLLGDAAIPCKDIGFNEPNYILVRFNARHIKYKCVRYTKLLADFLLRFLARHYPEALTAAGICNIHSLWACAEPLYYLLPPKLRHGDDGINVVIEVDHDEREHSARKWESAWRSDLSSTVGCDDDMLGGCEPEKRIKTRLEPMNDVEFFVPILPEKKHGAHESSRK